MRGSTSPLPRCAVWEERTEAKNKGGRSRLKSVPAKVYVQWEEGQRAPQCSPTGYLKHLRCGDAVRLGTYGSTRRGSRPLIRCDRAIDCAPCCATSRGTLAHLAVLWFQRWNRQHPGVDGFCPSYGRS